MYQHQQVVGRMLHAVLADGAAGVGCTRFRQASAGWQGSWGTRSSLPKLRLRQMLQFSALAQQD